MLPSFCECLLASYEYLISLDYNIAALYETGRGIGKNIEAALNWYQLAEDAGHLKAKLKVDSIRSQASGENNSDAGFATENNAALLHLYARKNELFKLKNVITKTKKVDTPDKYGKSALIIATEFGNKAIAEILLKHGANPEVKDMFGDTALLIAAQLNLLEIAETLLTFGANPNVCDANGNSPLAIAVRKGHSKLAETLLDAKASPNLVNNKGVSVLDIAITKKQDSLQRLLINAGAKSVASSPAQTQSSNISEQVLANNIVRDQKLNNDTPTPYENWPALNVAAWRGRQEIVNILLKTKIQLEGLDPENQTPLARAAWQGHSSIVTSLLDAGASPDYHAPGNASPLTLAIEHARQDIVTALLKARADVNQNTPEGEPVLLFALKTGNQDIALELIRFGANQDISFQGYSSLMRAAENGMDEVVTLILNLHKEQLNIQNKQGRTALWLAASSGQEISAEKLIASGANIGLADQDGYSPLACAAKGGYERIAKLLLDKNIDPDAG